MHSNHIFISFSHLDNQHVFEGEAGWVTSLVDSLRATLGIRLGFDPRFSVDLDLRSNQNQEWIDMIRNSALFLCVMSPNYTSSERCIRELHEFCQHAERTDSLLLPDGGSRAFMVIKSPLDSRGRLPAAAENMPYYTFYKETARGAHELDNLENKWEYKHAIFRLSADAERMIKTIMKLEVAKPVTSSKRMTEKNILGQIHELTDENITFPERQHLFISYTEADRYWANQLQQMIHPLLRTGGQKIKLWDANRIEPGNNWRAAIDSALAEAKVALLLVSAAYLASEFVMNEEVPKLLAAAEAEGLRVLRVSLSPCLVERTLIGGYQGVLPPGEFLAEMTKPEQQRALKMLSERILEALQVPAHEREQEPEDSALSTQLVVEHNETNSSEEIIRWRARCKIWKEPLAEDCNVPMAWIPPDAAQRVGEFLLGIEPVTLRQWQVVAGWRRQEQTLNPDPTEHGAPDQPVTGINQEQALEFCRRLAARSGRYYELPSEEQWDHACRAGSTSPYSWGDLWSVNLATAFANPWGLQKMHGSVWQWCRGEGLRGGSWNVPSERRQASSRATAKDPLHPSSVGLRVCCLPFGTPYFQLEASKSQWRPIITRAACAKVLDRPLTESEFIQLEQALQRFRILGILQLRLFLALLVDRLGAGADDPEQPLSLESDRDRISLQPPSIFNDVFTMAAFAWRERGWHRLADQAMAPRQVMAELGLAIGQRQQDFLQSLDRAAAAFPEPL